MALRFTVIINKTLGRIDHAGLLYVQGQPRPVMIRSIFRSQGWGAPSTEKTSGFGLTLRQGRGYGACLVPPYRCGPLAVGSGPRFCPLSVLHGFFPSVWPDD